MPGQDVDTDLRVRAAPPGARPPHVAASWLALREPADAEARSEALVDELRPHLPVGPIVVHDLGSGTGSMGRWLAPRLDGPQHWVLHDRQHDLLDVATAELPLRAHDAAAVTVETVRDDVALLTGTDLAGAALVTASALLDMLTADELDHVLDACVAARCPVLLTISVVGEVVLSPAHPLDEPLRLAFNAHQRRTTDGRALLGPDAVGVAAAGLRRRGHDVLLRPSPWRLGAGQRELMAEWLAGWVGAACEQEPLLAREADGYARRRLAAASAGDLDVTVHHLDLLALPR